MGGDISEQLSMTLEMMREAMRRNEETMRVLMEENQRLRQDLAQLRQEVRSGPPENPLQDEVMRKYKRKKKDIIQSKILDVAQKREIPLPELKEIIVDEHRYCSRATFYRYVKDIVSEGKAQVVDDRLVVDVYASTPSVGRSGLDDLQ